MISLESNFLVDLCLIRWICRSYTWNFGNEYTSQLFLLGFISPVVCIQVPESNFKMNRLAVVKWLWRLAHTSRVSLLSINCFAIKQCCCYHVWPPELSVPSLKLPIAVLLGSTVILVADNGSLLPTLLPLLTSCSLVLFSVSDSPLQVLTVSAVNHGAFVACPSYSPVQFYNYWPCTTMQ